MIALDTNEEKSSPRLWIFAGIVALALHVGGAALAIVQLRADIDGGSLGAQGTEIGLDLTSLGTEVTDLPPGPESEAVQATPPAPDQKAVEKETDLPKAAVNETEDPDRIVTQAESKKPEKDEPEPAAVQTVASPEQAASEATAPQVIEDARVAPKQTVVNQGIGKDQGKLTADWGRKITAIFELHKKYPNDKKRAATVKVSLVINRRGNVMSVDVIEVFRRHRLRRSRDLDDPPLRSSAAAAGRSHRRSIFVQAGREVQQGKVAAWGGQSEACPPPIRIAPVNGGHAVALPTLRRMPAITRRHFRLKQSSERSALLQQRAHALFQRNESFLRRDGGDEVVIVPRIL